ncbi:MAG: helix-turn-helix transcriptional regulator [Ignavibacteria bacterium]|nr:helix-turn-helix transcriptional regulator [Ignavibacteria bacterium]
MIALLLKSYRSEQRLTQKELAAQLGISREHYSRLENGHAMPSLGVFERMCSELKLQMPSFLESQDQHGERIADVPVCQLCRQLSLSSRKKVIMLVQKLAEISAANRS